MPEALVQFDAVTFAHAGCLPTVCALSLSCLSGQTTVLVGRSGAGKSTLLKLVNRLLLPTAGEVRVQGRNTRDWDAIRLRRRVGYVMQDVGLFPHMSVEDNVSVVPRLEGWEPARVAARTTELLDLVGLPPATYASRLPSELSGGQRQRVGLARALAVDPPILLMDEPFGALDPITRHEVRESFVQVQRHLGTLVILVTHDINEAFRLGDRIGVMEAGRLIAYGSRDEIAAAVDPRVRALVALHADQPGRPA